MFSFFTELNRKHPPEKLLDFVMNTTCPIVHAGDDRSVMETLEALPYQVSTTRSFAGKTAYRVGPSGIGARDNPHGRTYTPNPDNERAVGKQLATLLPDVFLTLSSDVAPQIREYPRASTAAVNAYAMPVSLPYLRGLSERLKRESFPNSPLIMLSSGGVVGAETAGRNPARMIESGPAAGSLAGCHYAEVLGIQPLMSFDIGGTTAKACRSRMASRSSPGRLKWTGDGAHGQWPACHHPSIDMIEIGAGGGVSLGRQSCLLGRP